MLGQRGWKDRVFGLFLFFQTNSLIEKASSLQVDIFGNSYCEQGSITTWNIVKLIIFLSSSLSESQGLFWFFWGAVQYSQSGAYLNKLGLKSSIQLRATAVHSKHIQMEKSLTVLCKPEQQCSTWLCDSLPGGSSCPRDDSIQRDISLCLPPKIKEEKVIQTPAAYSDLGRCTNNQTEGWRCFLWPTWCSVCINKTTALLKRYKEINACQSTLQFIMSSFKGDTRFPFQKPS